MTGVSFRSLSKSFGHLKILENIDLEIASGELRIGDRRASGILNLFSYLDRYPRQLSGGQRQRVAMGRAIVREPPVNTRLLPKVTPAPGPHS